VIKSISVNDPKEAYYLRIILVMSLNNFCIVTPNLNMKEYLAETIESVLINLQKSDKYFVIDGGSNDGSVEIIKKYSKWLTGWLSEKDAGYADALSKGFMNTGNCDFQCWLNSGDLLLPGAINHARSILSKGDADLIYGNDLTIDYKNKILQVTNGNLSNLHNIMLFAGWTPPQDACFWRSDLYQKVGGIRTDLKYAADFDLFLRMSHLGRSAYSDHIYSAFRVHAGQKSVFFSALYEQERQKVRMLLLNQNRSVLLQRIKIMYHWIKIRLHNHLFRTHRLNKKFSGKNISQIITKA
jgi:glycosyltransferase involved in cell wall biosynthesis